jgi:hypothetical protein
MKQHGATAAPPRTLPLSGAARRRPLRCIALGSLLGWVLLSAQAQPAAWTGLHVETCTAAVQACVGEAESADAWLPPGAGAVALRELVEALRAARGLPGDTPVRISCSSGAPDTMLVNALSAAGYRVVLSAPAMVAAR